MSTFSLTKDELVELCEEADKRNYNRRLHTEAIRLLGDEVFLLQIILLHEYVAGVKQPVSNLHFRCRVTKYVKGQSGQTIGFLDVPLTYFTMDTIDAGRG